MSQTDNALPLIVDSSSTLLVDSTSVSDSLQLVDTVFTDTLKAFIDIPHGFDGIQHPSLPHSESWVFGILLFLFFVFALSASRSSGLIQETIRTFFQVKERSSIFSKVTLSDFRIRFFMIFFSIGVFSLYAYLTLNTNETLFSLRVFIRFFMITILFVGIKLLLIRIMGYVFLDKISLRMANESYFNILSLLGVALFPLLVLHIYSPSSYHQLVGTISVTICIIGLILLIIKLFQIFYHKIVASFYILLYLCTLEFLPLVALKQLYQLIIWGV